MEDRRGETARQEACMHVCVYVHTVWLVAVKQNAVKSLEKLH